MLTHISQGVAAFRRAGNSTTVGNDPARRRGRAGRGRAAGRCVAEAVERRLFLSAGDPNREFGIGGLAQVDVAYAAQTVDMDSAGNKTVIVADVYGEKHQMGMVVVRLGSTGRPDATFGGGTGMVHLPYAADRVLVKPSGKVVIAARAQIEGGVDEAYTQPRLIQLRADGTLDRTFSGDGVAELQFDVGAMARASDGVVWVAGPNYGSGLIQAADIQIDGSVGHRRFGFELYGGNVTSILLPSDGSVVLAASAVQYMPLDPNQSQEPVGEALFKVGGSGGSWGGPVVLPDGYRIGDATLAPGGDVLVAAAKDGKYVQPLRYNADGTFDRAYTSLVRNTEASPFGWVSVSDVQVAADGKAVVFTGGGSPDEDGGPAVARYNADGTLDKTFAPGLGYRPTVGDQGDLQDDGKIVVAGGGVTAARYWYADGPNTMPFVPAADGTLTLNSTGGADTVRVHAAPVVQGGPVVWRVRVNEFYRAVDPAKVKRIVVNAGAGDDVIDLSAVGVATVIYGGSGNDMLAGGGGNDLLDGGTGRDDLHGNAGNDTADYTTRTASVTVSLDDNNNDGQAGEWDNVFTDVENVNGGGGNDVLRGSAVANVLRGNGGNDHLFGGAGNDRLFGNSGNDLLRGEGDNDRLDGGSGADDMSGGDGTDTLDYGARTGGVYVGLGTYADDGEAGEHDNARNDNEVVIGGAGRDTFVGTSAANVFYGGGGDDILYGRGGNDTLHGGSGRNRLYGEDGDDTFYVRNGLTDQLDGGTGYDAAQRDPFDVLKSIEKAL